MNTQDISTCQSFHSTPSTSLPARGSTSSLPADDLALRPVGTKLGFRKGMVIASLNVNSLPAHIDEIRLLLHKKNIHILALNEAKIDSDYASELPKIEGYRFDRLDHNRRGGGIGFYIRDSFEVDVWEDIPVSTLELRCMKVKPIQVKPFFVVSWY